ncbi:MAG: nucleotidyltransferase domain-containing protein [Flavobacteriales bacterium]|jgi:predicted nucleotidyltransferase|nr:nucleotidyltransferase domain-containing protein [Flavobacteriales bacterium]
MEILINHLESIKGLCRINTVRSLFAFGSVTTDKFNDASDIDLVVDIDDKDPISYSDKYFNLKFALEDLLQRKIDLLEEKAIRNPLFKQHLNEKKVLIYGN